MKKKKATTTKTKTKPKPKPQKLQPFEAVWTIVLQVPRGKVISYGEVSRLVLLVHGCRLSPLAVGWALRAAPDGALPWQRVVSAMGAISTDKEQPDRQRKLLLAEGVRFRDRCVDMDRHAWSLRVAKKTKKKAVAKKASVVRRARR